MRPDQEFLHFYNGSDEIANKMVGFAQSGVQRGVQNFIFEEQARNVPTNMEGFIGVFARDGRIEITTLAEELDLQKLYDAALNAAIPQRIIDLQTTDDPLMRVRNMHLAAFRDYPYAMFGIGKTQDTQKPVTILFVMAGVSAPTALQELQRAITTTTGRRRTK